MSSVQGGQSHADGKLCMELSDALFVFGVISWKKGKLSVAGSAPAPFHILSIFLRQVASWWKARKNAYQEYIWIEELKEA